MPSASYGLIVEGIYDTPVFEELIWQLRGHAVQIEIREAGDRTRVVSQAPGLLRSFEHVTITAGPVDKALVIRDSDGKPPEDLEALMHHRIIEGRLFPFPNGVDVHATHQETETWLLADAGAIGRVAQLRGGRAVAPVRDPLEAIVRPKERFQALLSSARLPYTPDVCRAIARATDLDILRQRCPSFSRFAQKLQ